MFGRPTGNNDHGTPRRPPAAEVARIQGGGLVQLVGLNLTSEQQGKIKEIAARHQPEIEKLRSSLRDATDKKPVRNQIRDLQAKMLDEVKAALTPGQIAQLQPAGRRLQASK